MCKNIQCPSCSSVLALIKDGKTVFSEMKAISRIELNMDNLTTDVKCHTCHNWSSIDHESKITQNYKRKSQDVMYAAESKSKKK